MMDKYRRERLVEFLDSMELELKESRSGRLLWTQSEEERRRKSKMSRKNGASGSASSSGVWLGTVHQSKGLEWKVVFIISMMYVRFSAPSPLFVLVRGP